jgi:hypothetical protein
MIWHYAKGRPKQVVGGSLFDPLKYLARDEWASAE